MVIELRERNIMKMNPTRFFGAGAIVCFAATFACMAVDAWAQGATPATLDKVTLSGDAAKRTLTRTQINAATARASVGRSARSRAAMGLRVIRRCAPGSGAE